LGFRSGNKHITGRPRLPVEPVGAAKPPTNW
jgi:hypothetical protein